MTDQTTRHALIRKAIATSGQVPPIRTMQDILALDGVQVSASTIHADYTALGYRDATAKTVIHSVKLPVEAYDACCRLALRRNTSVSAVIRALVAIGLSQTPRAAA